MAEKVARQELDAEPACPLKVPMGEAKPVGGLSPPPREYQTPAPPLAPP